MEARIEDFDARIEYFDARIIFLKMTRAPLSKSPPKKNGAWTNLEIQSGCILNVNIIVSVLSFFLIECHGVWHWECRWGLALILFGCRGSGIGNDRMLCIVEMGMTRGLAWRYKEDFHGEGLGVVLDGTKANLNREGRNFHAAQKQRTTKIIPSLVEKTSIPRIRRKTGDSHPTRQMHT